MEIKYTFSVERGESMPAKPKEDQTENKQRSLAILYGDARSGEIKIGVTIRIT